MAENGTPAWFVIQHLTNLMAGDADPETAKTKVQHILQEALGSLDYTQTFLEVGYIFADRRFKTLAAKHALLHKGDLIAAIYEFARRKQEAGGGSL